MNKNVNHPEHYTREGHKECIEEIKDTIGTVGAIYFCLGNAMKYQYRADKKGNMCEDLLKASWYIDKATELNKVLPTKLAEMITGFIEAVQAYNPRIGDDDNE